MRRRPTLAALATIVSSASCGGGPSPALAPPLASPPPTSAASATLARLPAEPVPLGPLPSDEHPTHERLSLTIDPEATRFGGTASIDLALERPRDVLWLHGRGLAVRSCALVSAKGEHVDATWSEADPSGVARVSLAHAVVGEATLTIQYEAPYDPSLVGVYRTAVGRTHAVFSKFEAIYARRAFPGFDEPSFKVPFDVTLTVPKGATALGNMPVATSIDADGKQVVTFATTPPLPTYLVAFAVGPFETRQTTVAATELRSTPLPLNVIALPSRAADTGFAVAEAPALVANEERYYGVAFPFPKLDLLAIPDFQSGAMENAGLITFRDSALLVDAKASTSQRIDVLDAVAHEIAHQWFGDLVTMRWWDDLWLNESFASFLATKALRAVKPELELELREVGQADQVMKADGLASTRRIRQPITGTDDISNAFDHITYAKGEAVLSMVEGYVGADAFRRGLHEYLTAHLGGNASTNDLVGALSKASGRDLGPLFMSFLDHPGAPLIATHATCENGKGSIALEQSRWLPYGSTSAKDVAWSVPVCARASVGGKVVEACRLLEAATGSIPLAGCADWFMPNADARGYYRFTEDAADLARLRDHGTAKLTAAERMMLAEDMEAAFRSASLSSGEALAALRPLARDAHGAVASAPLGLYRFISDELLDDASRAKLRRYVGALYAPAVKSLGWRAAPNESTWRTLERGRVLEFLARRMGDPSVLREAARLGRAYLGLGRAEGATRAEAPATDGALHPEVVDPELAGLAVAAAVIEGGAPVFDAVEGVLAKLEDEARRRTFLLALASTREPALVARALDLSLDASLRKNERLTMLTRLLDGRETRDQAWTWVVAHFDALAPMLPDRYGGRFPLDAHFCDAKKADEVNAFFTPRVPSLTGGTRNLAQAVESIATCAKLADAQRQSARRFVNGL